MLASTALATANAAPAAAKATTAFRPRTMLGTYQQEMQLGDQRLPQRSRDGPPARADAAPQTPDFRRGKHHVSPSSRLKVGSQRMSFSPRRRAAGDGSCASPTNPPLPAPNPALTPYESASDRSRRARWARHGFDRTRWRVELIKATTLKVRTKVFVPSAEVFRRYLERPAKGCLEGADGSVHVAPGHLLEESKCPYALFGR
jgi:hypothetical protein